MIKNLQVLRALAALLVVFYHYHFYGLYVGAFGVDIFFVISGFIISFVISKTSDDFFKKRLIRIIPMYYLVTVFLIVLWLIRPGFFHNVYVDATTIIKSLFFIPYTIGDGGPILSSGWTLNYEMYFYLIVSFFLFVTKDARKTLFFSILFLLGVCVYKILSSSGNRYILFYGNSCVTEFIFGILLFFINEKIKPKPGKSSFIMMIAGILSFAVMVYCSYHHYTKFPLISFSIPAFIITGYFIFSDGSWKEESRIYKWLYRMGNASYTMYLIHPFIIYIPPRLINVFIKIKNPVFLTAELILSIGLVCVASDIVHRKIERPMLKKIGLWVKA